jgi:predicted  nucleic acid-binding Zn-ribbon protein
MVIFSELRICKTCGNVFSTLAGVVKISNCPQCARTDFDTIKEDEELVQE